MKFGYARVSTEGQEFEAQCATLKNSGCQRIFAEKKSGAQRARPELDRLLDQVREGDIVIVTRLDRLARSTRDLLEIAERLHATGTGLCSLAEPWADTTSPAGRMVLTVFAGIAEFERSLIRERTDTGRRDARQRGVRFGRPVALTPEQIIHATKLVEGGQGARAVARTLGIHPATLYRALQKSA